MAYKNYDFFVLRTPLYSKDLALKLYSENYTDEEELKKIYSKKEIQEAIFVASPELYDALNKWLEGRLTKSKKIRYLHNSMTKYLIRMSTRCTPFGLMAGCSQGIFSHKTDIQLQDLRNYKRVTRLDMKVLLKIINDIQNHEKILDELKFFPNNSHYRVNDKIRYVEFVLGEKSLRKYRIVETDNDITLSDILDYLSPGRTIKEIENKLISDGFDENDSKIYIAELIKNQLLISELEPTVSGNNLLKDLENNLKTKPSTSLVLHKLIDVKNILKAIDDSKIGNSINSYEEIVSNLNSIFTGFNSKNIVQVDLYKKLLKNKLDNNINEDILSGLELFNKLTQPYKNQNLENFKKEFVKRYEESEQPLAKVLDSEIGIGYGLNTHSDQTDFLEDVIPYRGGVSNEPAVVISKKDHLVFKKFIEWKARKTDKIVLKDEELKDYPVNWSDLPETIAVMVELFEDKNKYNDTKIVLSGFGGSSAGNLLGRFCHLDKKIEGAVKNIVKTEDELSENKIIAEIVHLPEARSGNVILRPMLRKYEIPYLSKSKAKNEFQITINDLYISIKHNKVILRSRKLNKEIIPRLTNAHNYSFQSLPIYHFLCDIQQQNIRGGLAFSWGILEHFVNHFPRVEYKNIIISPESWKFSIQDFKTILEKKNFDDQKLELDNFIKKHGLPEKIILSEGDNTLWINLKNDLCIKSFLSMVKKKTVINLVESFVEKKSIVNDNGIEFTNQVVITYHRIKEGQNGD